MNSVSSPAAARPRVLLIDADVERSIVDRLRDAGFFVTRTYAEPVRSRIEPPDVVIVDARSPHLDALTTVRGLKAMRFALAVVVIGTFRSGNRRSDLLEAGADDVMEMPVGADELVARLRAILRRVKPDVPDTAQADTQDLCLCDEHHEPDHDGLRTTLTRTEFVLFTVLSHNIGRVVTRRDLMLMVWGVTVESKTNVLNAYVCSLRRKLVAVGSPYVVHTVRGVGFSLGEVEHAGNLAPDRQVPVAAS
ncbi:MULTISPECIES: response regulator transcription factor [unclassified Rhodococcus (in: high G+C Gram-positive bacteria)]|uniref:response regulator transcription factor n=1 Tax=unclassified Rhodococcus (in: high G+C Gram-positive bacteria) TaxID=192944 RepID=UPI00163999BC|nr:MULTISPECIES: response regulator transcription factor [unclassified Rhodococcus (in: high G+C Gram-positive bacteria)]MBC2637950.1 response regulator transcription factor [Rhodococcus sp. 3A]MBC2897303.1 response regulator transcription factor [Rhodococcus sp. 4CII]